jgi:hypothetical protein
MRRGLAADEATLKSRRAMMLRDRLLGFMTLLLLLVPLALFGLFVVALLPSPNSSTFAVAGLVGAFVYVQLLFTIGGRIGTNTHAPSTPD